MKVSPSILSCDFSIMKDELNSISTADFIHVDVMDGMFVPNLTLGAPIVKSIRKHSNALFDVHLMINEPIRYIKDFVDAGSDYITVHVEACANVRETLELIKRYNCKRGISIKPNTRVCEITEYLPMVDMVLVMSVEPGFGGQSFIETSVDKIQELSNLKKEYDYNYLINVDGGINNETGLKCKNAGADILVAGSYIFGKEDRKQVIEELKNI